MKLYVRGTPLQRFMARARVGHWADCWPWDGAQSDQGYGRFTLNPRRRINAHRWLYEHVHGRIPDGLWLDHLCRNRLCVNPIHLEAVTPRENTLRGKGPAARHARKTHCDNGHEFTEANIRWYGPQRRWRDCRACKRERGT